MSPTGITAGDYNSDGKLDIAFCNWDTGTASVFLGNGDGTFKAVQDFPTSYNSSGIFTADMNNDGKPDLLVSDDGYTITLLVTGVTNQPPVATNASATIAETRRPRPSTCCRAAAIRTGTP